MNPSNFPQMVHECLVRHGLRHAVAYIDPIADRLLKAGLAEAGIAHDFTAGFLAVVDAAAMQLVDELVYWNRVQRRCDTDHGHKRPRNWRAPLLPDVLDLLAIEEQPAFSTSSMATQYQELVWSVLKFCCDLYLRIDELQGVSGQLVAVTDSQGVNRIVSLGQKQDLKRFSQRLKKAEDLAEKLDDSNPLDVVVFHQLARHGYRSAQLRATYPLRGAP